MDENPYQSPLAAGSKSKRLDNRSLFLVGCVFLAAISWLLGRGVIPKDEVALLFSLAAFPVAATLWGVLVRRCASRPGGRTVPPPHA
jgi:hypothetical protein